MVTLRKQNAKISYSEAYKEKANRLSKQIIGAAIEVHKGLGPGLLESTSEACLQHELNLKGLSSQRQVPLPLEYKGVQLDCGSRLDLLVENLVIVEIKAVEGLEPIHDAQLLTYLRLSGHWLGLLINFNMPVLKQGIKRLVQG
jgi:GxxExxY protein